MKTRQKDLICDFRLEAALLLSRWQECNAFGCAVRSLFRVQELDRLVSDRSVFGDSGSGSL